MPVKKPAVQAPKPYEPNVEVRHTGFIVVPTAAIFVDGECAAREVHMPQVEAANGVQLVGYAEDAFPAVFARFKAEREQEIAAHLSAQQNGDGG